MMPILSSEYCHSSTVIPFAVMALLLTSFLHLC